MLQDKLDRTVLSQTDPQKVKKVVVIRDLKPHPYKLNVWFVHH
jgi:hypothetical protein